MKPLLHLVRADIRRFWIVLAVWVLVVAGETVFRAIRPTFAAEPQLSMMSDLLSAVLFTTRWLGMILIVALVVQTHPLVGSDAFWMTRPISWRLLLASKLVLLVTTVVAVPAAAELVLMFVCRVPIREALPVAVHLVLLQCLWLAAFMALSSITRNLARLALVAGSVLIGLILLFNLMLVVMVRRLADGPQMFDVMPRSESNPGGLVAMAVLTVAAGFASVALQYRTRSVRTSVLTGVAGIGVAFAVSFFWPSGARLLPVPDWANRESAVQLSAEIPRGDFRPTHEGAPLTPGDGWQLGLVRLAVSAVEAGWLPTVKLKDATIGFDDGANVRTAGNGFATELVMINDSVTDAPHGVVARRVLGVTRLNDGPSSLPSEGTPAIILPDTEFRRRLGSRGTYRGSFLVDLDRLTVAATLPLQPGATYRNRRRRLTLDHVVPQARAATITLRHFTTSSMFDSDLSPQLSFYLRNRSTSEAVAGSLHGGFGSVSSGIGLPLLFGMSGFSAEAGGGFSITSQVIRFPYPYGGYPASGDTIEVTPEWLSQAELVIVHTIPAGSVPRSLDITGFEIAAAPPPKLSNR